MISFAALRRLRRDQRGFTLIELTTAMALFGIFIGAAALALGSAIRNSSATEDQSVTQAEVRAAVDKMASDIRQAYSDSTLPGTPYSIQTWTSTTLTFYTPDRLSPFHMQLVSYRLSSGEIQKAQAVSTNTGTVGPWTGVAAGNLGSYKRLVGTVTNAALFTYLQADGTTTATSLANLATIRITVTVSPRGSQGRTSTYIVNASPRI